MSHVTRFQEPVSAVERRSKIPESAEIPVSCIRRCAALVGNGGVKRTRGPVLLGAMSPASDADHNATQDSGARACTHADAILLRASGTCKGRTAEFRTGALSRYGYGTEVALRHFISRSESRIYVPCRKETPDAVDEHASESPRRARHYHCRCRWSAPTRSDSSCRGPIDAGSLGKQGLSESRTDPGHPVDEPRTDPPALSNPLF